MKELYGYDYAKTCPLIYAFTVVGARWKLPIVWYLTEVQRASPPRAGHHRHRLHELEDDGIITRHDAKTMPMSVTYHLTDVGKKLMPALKKLYGWGEEHRVAVENGRE